MLFHSTDFLIFFVVVLVLYALVRRSLGARNGLLLAASYIFYGWWDYRFLSLLLISSVVDYLVARRLVAVPADAVVQRRFLVGISIAVNLGILATFKYFGFFQESLATLLESFGMGVSWRPVTWVLPVGISFYTFQSMGYTIDVYRGDADAERDGIKFLAYVAFFPQLVAGPIERASHLLPQFSRTLAVDREAIELGVWWIVWGFFKKVVLADQLAPLVEMVYDQPSSSAPMLGLATIAFGFQIYCDFSGYTDIARGVARLMGFELMVNFRLPYFATNVREFWARWHISLSTWLRDYLYRPLGGNRCRRSRVLLNLMMTMLLGGLWHGAAANFVLWGFWHGMGLIVHRVWRLRMASRFALPAFVGWVLTMGFVFVGWAFFRATSPDHLWSMASSMGNWSMPVWWTTYAQALGVLVLPLLAMQVWQARSGCLDVVLRVAAWKRGLLEAVLLLCVIAFWESNPSPFIYFQF